MREPKCPACRCDVAKACIRRGTFQCPNWGAELRIPQIGRPVLRPVLLVGGVIVAFLLAHLFGLAGNSLLLGVILLTAPCGFGFALLFGAPRGHYFPGWRGIQGR